MPRPRPSITLLVAVVVASPIVVVAGILAGIAWVTNTRVAQKLADEVMDGAARRVAAEVQEYLRDAVQVSERFERRLRAGDLPDPPGQGWERQILDDLVTTPSVASICYGNASGDATWVLRGPGRLEVGRADGAAAGRTLEYVINQVTGRTVGQPLKDYTYDPRKRPWWTVAVESREPRWTPVYVWYAGNNAESMMGSGYVRAIRGEDRAVRGVLVIDVTLGALGEFLQKLEIARDGRVFIVDASGRMVAASRGQVTDERGEPVPLSGAVDPTARAVAAALAGGTAGEAETRTLSVTIDSAPARARVTHLSPFAGIDWRVIAVVPDAAFLSEAQSMRNRAVLVAGLAILGSLALGLLLSRHLSRPIVSMTRHVKRVGQGDFETRLALQGARELVVLSDEINSMAAGLKARVALEQSLQIAMEVQQSLLPAADPVTSLLDVAGRSRYCDSTGGDYFDFLDVSAESPGSLLVAVGDVMGHGIAAALLMASARAALRTHAMSTPRLAELMTRTNRVLTADSRHNRFMTLALLRIQASPPSVHWASAGHDPAIVFDPQTDMFYELEGGDLPLGVDDSVDYQQFHHDGIAPGSVMIIGTDGIWEMQSEQGKMYGKDRMRELIRRHSGGTAAEIAAALEDDLKIFRGTRESQDDVTFVIVRFRER